MNEKFTNLVSQLKNTSRRDFRAFSLISISLLLTSSLMLFAFQISKLSPLPYLSQRIEDDVKAMKKAYDDCKKGYGEKFSRKTIIQIELSPPETKTNIKRKFILDRDCKIIFTVW
ncbi:hypothetical protein HRbin19_00768 [bacterium HR19]|nr:hypothetical protein HRbin19_00768 [bacterium HR19]